MSDVATGEIVHHPDSGDHFEVLGLPRRLVVDQDALAKRYYALSRRYHPDFHQTGTTAERVVSLRRTAAINDAYKTLRDPVARGRWWLEHNGRRLGSSPEVPSDLAMLVFEVQEVLDGLRADPGHASNREAQERLGEVESGRARRIEALERNFARWDALPERASPEPLLDELQRLLAEISYLTTLLRDIERTMEICEAR